MTDGQLDILNIWAGMFTDNCSEDRPFDLYKHYVAFAQLFSRGKPLNFKEFKPFTIRYAPMGFHDGEDTDNFIGNLRNASFYGSVYGPMTAADPELSPIEQKFWDAHRTLFLPALAALEPQYPVLRYRLDFALPQRKIGIELDGFATHSSTRDIENDRSRQREIEEQGWRIIRFGGREVHRDPARCVQQAARMVESFRGQR